MLPTAVLQTYFQHRRGGLVHLTESLRHKIYLKLASGDFKPLKQSGSLALVEMPGLFILTKNNNIQNVWDELESALVGFRSVKT